LRSFRDKQGSEGKASVTESWPRDLADTRAGELSHLDITVPNPARMWNYWLGGKDNFSVDRDMADKVQQALPSVREIARAMRRFLIDAVHRIAADHGVRQFLDIGAGLPTAENTHEVAQRAAPESRIVYADNDRCKSGCAHLGMPEHAIQLFRCLCLSRNKGPEPLPTRTGGW
jgi:hypothetical protein